MLMISFSEASIAAGDNQDAGKEGADIISKLREELDIYPLKPPNTSSPRATLDSFLENMNAAYRLLMIAHRRNMEEPGFFTSKSVRELGSISRVLFERGMWCLNLSEVPDALKLNVGYEGSIILKEIIDRIQLPPLETLPDAQDIENDIENEKVPDLLNFRLLWTDIVIARVEEGPRKGQFLFSPDTVARLDEFYSKVAALPYRNDDRVSPGFLEFYDRTPGRLLPPKWSRWLPEWSTQNVFYYQTLWQWLVLIFLPLLATAFIWMIHRFWMDRARTLTPVKRSWRQVGVVLIAVVTVEIVLVILIEQVGISGPLLIRIDAVLRAINWFLLAYAALLAGNAIGKTIGASQKLDPRGIHAGLVEALSSIIGVLTATIIIFYGLSSLGVSILPLLTGLGVGGLAVALAARPTIENFIGGLMILVDRPLRVGQRVRVKNYEGYVEKIGFRSTRIRTLTGFQTILPNEEMARLDIENIDRRPYIRRKFTIGITYDTPPEKVEMAVKLISEILSDHEGLNPKRPPKVLFEDFSADSLDIVIRYWCYGLDLWAFRSLNHRVNLEIMRAFEKEGIDFAFPTTTNYLTQENEKPLQIKITDSDT